MHLRDAMFKQEHTPVRPVVPLKPVAPVAPATTGGHVTGVRVGTHPTDKCMHGRCGMSSGRETDFHTLEACISRQAGGS